MIEVEVRAKVKDFNEIKDKLKNIGAEFSETIHQADKIFGHPKFLDENNMIIEGGIVPRIRCVNDNCFLEFKEINRKRGAGIEIKSDISDVNQGVDFLNKLGFKETFTINKKRESYKYKNFSIDLDEVEKLGFFIEIEKTIKSDDEKETAKKECLELLKIVSPEGRIENKKYGDLIQEIINKEKQNIN